MPSPTTLTDALRVLTGQFSFRYRAEAAAVAMGERHLGDILALPGGQIAAKRIWTACRDRTLRVTGGETIRSDYLLCDALVSDLKNPTPAISDFLLDLLNSGKFQGSVGVICAAIVALGESEPRQEIATALLDFLDNFDPDAADPEVRNLLSDVAFLSAVRMLPGTTPETFRQILDRVHEPRLRTNPQEAACVAMAIAACSPELVSAEGRNKALGIIHHVPAAAAALEPGWLGALALDSILRSGADASGAVADWDDRCVVSVLNLAVQNGKDLPGSYAEPLEGLIAISSSGAVRQAAMFLRASMADPAQREVPVRGTSR